MKKFNLKKMLAFALVAVMTFGVLSMNVSAAQVDVSGTDMNEAVALAADAGYELDDETRAQLEAIVKDAADSLDIVEEGADPAKSTFVTFKEHPVKVVKYDGEGHGLKAAAYKTVGIKYVADAKVLYVGMTEDGTIYRSFKEPVEVGFYYAVCMYEGDANNYPSVSYGIVIILPACEPCPPVTPEEPDEPTTEEPTTEEPTTEEPTTEEPTTEESTTEEPTTEEPTTEEPTTEEPTTEEPTTEEPATEAPVEDTTASEEEAPKTGDNSQVILYVAVSVVALAGAAIVIKKRNA